MEGKPVRWPLWVGNGCLVLLGLGIGAPIGAYWLYSRHAQEELELAHAAQQEKAKQEFDPVLQKMQPDDQSYDIDTTIRVVHQIDLAMQQHRSPEEMMALMAATDYREVAPEVLEKRRELLTILFELYADQTRAEDQQAAFEFTSQLVLSTLSLVSVSGSIDGGPHGSFTVDRKQAQKLLDDLEQKQDANDALKSDIDRLQQRLFEANLAYADVYYKYVEEWDRLCILRDRAYLAERDGDWDTVIATTDEAIRLAPKEKEAHLLGAQARIEKGDPEDLTRAEELLNEYLADHADATAPAFLLLGALEQRRGDKGASRLHLEQAAAYYPKQAEALTDMLDPYQMRSYLRQSREGTSILEDYKSTMLGAGYFSPDLQLARAAFDAGDFNGGKQKVLDHFARRRAQGQWDFLLSDISYAHDLLGGQFREIFPEESYLDLTVAPTMWGDQIQVGVANRSDRTLHNATLVLCVHFTDMMAGDYEPFTAPATLPAVAAHETTDFGDMSVKSTILGKERSVADIVSQRAILVTDEAVLWVDTDEFKISEAKEFQRARELGKPVPEQTTDWHQGMTKDLATAAREVAARAAVEVVPKYGKDDLTFRIPEGLAVFRPNFRLEYGDVVVQPDQNVIENGQIVVTFSGIDNLDADGAEPKPAALVLSSVFGEWRFAWKPDGHGGYALDKVAPG
jgi:hypothetical protein